MNLSRLRFYKEFFIIFSRNSFLESKLKINYLLHLITEYIALNIDFYPSIINIIIK